MPDIHAVVKRTMRLSDPALEIELRTPLCFTDKAANAFIIDLLNDDNTAASLDGLSIYGIFVRADNTDVSLTGSVSGNETTVVLSAGCYQHMGRFVLTIKLMQGTSVIRTLAIIRGRTIMDVGEAHLDPEHIMPSLPELIETAQQSIAAIETKGELVLASIPDDYETVAEEAEWLGFGIASADGITAIKNFNYGGDGWIGANAIFLFADRFINGIKILKIRTKYDNQDVKLLLLKKQGNDYVIVDERTQNTGTNGYVDFGSIYVAGEYYAAIQGCFVVRTDAGVTDGYICSTADIVNNKLTNLTQNTQYAPSTDLVFFQAGEIDPDFFEGTDAEKLQKAFDLCEINGGTIVIRRKYTLADTVTIRHSYVQTNRIIVRGDAVNSEICVNALFGFVGVSGATGGVLFRDLKFSSIDPVNVTSGLLNGGLVVGADDTLVNIIFENCCFFNLKYIHFANRYVQSLWFIGCVIRIAGTMIYTGGYPWYNTIIRNCIIEDNSAIGSISWGEGVFVHDNVIEGNTHVTAIDVLHGAYSVCIENNFFEGNNRDVTLSLTQPDRTVRIIGNVFVNTATAPITLPQAANPTYGGAIVIESNKYLHSSDHGMAQYMIYGTSGETYNEVLCAFNSGDITSLDSSELPIWKPADFTGLCDAILYEKIALNSAAISKVVIGGSEITANPSMVETGSTISSVTLAYTANKAPTSMTLKIGSGTAQAVTPAGANGTVTNGSLSLTSATPTNVNLVLSATDSGSFVHDAYTASRTVVLSFAHAIYYGAAAEPGAVDSAFIKGLSYKRLKTSKAGNYSANVTSGKYFWFCSPYGTCNFVVNGLAVTFVEKGTVTITNDAGASVTYTVYRSPYAGTGSTTITVS